MGRYLYPPYALTCNQHLTASVDPNTEVTSCTKPRQSESPKTYSPDRSTLSITSRRLSLPQHLTAPTNIPCHFTYIHGVVPDPVFKHQQGLRCLRTTYLSSEHLRPPCPGTMACHRAIARSTSHRAASCGVADKGGPDCHILSLSSNLDAYSLAHFTFSHCYMEFYIACTFL